MWSMFLLREKGIVCLSIGERCMSVFGESILRICVVMNWICWCCVSGFVLCMWFELCLFF